MLNGVLAQRAPLSAVLLILMAPHGSSADTNGSSSAGTNWSLSHLVGVAWTDDGSKLTHSEPFNGRVGNAPIGSLRLRYQLGRTLSLEASALYGRTTTKRDEQNPDRLRVQLFSPRADVVVHPKRWGAVRPYVAVGLATLSVDRQPRANEFRSAATQTALAANLGLGGEYTLSKALALRLDGRAIGFDDGGGGLGVNAELSMGLSVAWGHSSKGTNKNAAKGRDVWQ